MALIQAVLSSKCPKMYLKFMASLISQLCGDSLLAVFLSRQDGAIYKPPKHSWTSDRLKNEYSIKADHCTFGYGTHMNY